MPNKRIEMDKIYEIQRLKKLGHTKAEVARIVGINRETVAPYWNQESPPEVNSPHWAKQVDWEYLKSELKSEIPRSVLYEELATSVSMPS